MSADFNEHDFTKRIKWHGKSFGALEGFIQQLRREGVDPNAELNPHSDQHVYIEVELPLATEPSPIVHRHGPADPHTEECAPRPMLDSLLNNREDKLPEF